MINYQGETERLFDYAYNNKDINPCKNPLPVKSDGNLLVPNVDLSEKIPKGNDQTSNSYNELDLSALCDDDFDAILN